MPLTVNGHNFVRDRNGNITISGTAPPGSTVTISQGGNPLGQATADDQGNWSITVAMAPGSSSIDIEDGEGDSITDYAIEVADPGGADPTPGQNH